MGAGGPLSLRLKDIIFGQVARGRPWRGRGRAVCQRWGGDVGRDLILSRSLFGQEARGLLLRFRLNAVDSTDQDLYRGEDETRVISTGEGCD